MEEEKNEMSMSNLDVAEDSVTKSKRKANKMWTVCIFILVVEMCERLTYYAFAGSQRYFLMGPLGYGQAQATSLNATFSVLCYFTPLLGGWLADAKWGRFKTIVVLTICYIIGVFLAAIAAHPAIYNNILYFIGTMGLIALGSGGIKPNVSNLGGDQFDVNDPKEAKDQEQFFSYFYLMINVGAGISYGYLTTLAQNGAPPGIPKDMGYFAVYMIASCAMALAFAIFLISSKRYVKKPASGDSLRGLLFYIYRGAGCGMKGKVALAGWIILLAFLTIVVASSFLRGSINALMSYISFGLGVVMLAMLSYAHLDCQYLESVPDHPGGFMTNLEGRDALEVVPTLLIVNVCFSVVYNQMNGPFQSQACQMNLWVGGTQLNAAFFNIADCLAIIIFVPILENVAYPLLGRLKGSPVTLKQKLVAGLAVAGLSMLVAAGLEYLRRGLPILEAKGEVADPVCCRYDSAAKDFIDQCLHNTKSRAFPDGPMMTAEECVAAGKIASINDFMIPNRWHAFSACMPLSAEVPMRQMSSFIMFIPFFIVGLAECLVNPVLMYFVYDQAPPRTRSIVQAFNMLCMGSISNGFTAAITSALAPFYTDNLDDGHIEYFYWVGLAFSVIGIPISLFIMGRFTPKNYTETIEGIETSSGDLLADDGEKLRRRSSLLPSRMSARE